MQDLPEEFLVGCFISGSWDAIKYDVVAKNPNTMMEATRLARVEEEKLLNIRKSSKVTFLKGGNSTSPNGSTTTSKGFVAGAPHNANNPVERLTPQEMSEKRGKGLCFYCDEKYVAGHKCQPRRLLRLNILLEP